MNERKNKPGHDIAIRLPADKKHLKTALWKVAVKNNMTFTQLMVIVIENFFDDYKAKNGITVKLK